MFAIGKFSKVLSTKVVDFRELSLKKIKIILNYNWRNHRGNSGRKVFLWKASSINNREQSEPELPCSHLSYFKLLETSYSIWNESSQIMRISRFNAQVAYTTELQIILFTMWCAQSYSYYCLRFWSIINT